MQPTQPSLATPSRCLATATTASSDLDDGCCDGAASTSRRGRASTYTAAATKTAANSAIHRVKTEVKLNNRRGVLIDLYSQALSQRSGKTGYEGYTTCALGRMRVLGKDILDKTGDCIGLTGRNQSSDSTTIEKTFFTGKYSYPILVFSLDVDLKASGAIEAKYTSTALTGVPGANGVWWNGEKSYAKTVIGATADLRTRSQLSFGVPYVAGVAVEGSLSLIKLNFKPSQTSSRDTNIFTGTYKRSTSMPFELDGLDGRVRLIARGPLNSIIDKTTIWDPKPLVEYDRNLMNKTTSSTYNFVSY